MKYILKESPPPEFEQWKKSFEAASGQPPTYSDFKGQVKKRFKQSLLIEQGYICCYCMARIHDYDSHIEHFVPRAESRRDPHSVIAQDVQLNYKNLFLSCEGEYDDGQWDGKHCGQAKKDEGSAMLISPSDSESSSVFEYDMQGNIRGITAPAMTTVRVLNLQDPALIRHRRTAIFRSGILDGDEDLDELVEMYQSKDEDGAYAPFCESILYVLKKLA